MTPRKTCHTIFLIEYTLDESFIITLQITESPTIIQALCLRQIYVVNVSIMLKGYQTNNSESNPLPAVQIYESINCELFSITLIFLLFRYSSSLYSSPWDFICTAPRLDC